LRVCIGVNEYGRVGARRKELEEEKQRKMLQNAEEAKRKLQVSCVRICVGTYMYICVYIYMLQNAELAKRKLQVSCVRILLMGTAALYRVCSTGLR